MFSRDPLGERDVRQCAGFVRAPLAGRG